MASWCDYLFIKRIMSFWLKMGWVPGNLDTILSLWWKPKSQINHSDSDSLFRKRGQLLVEVSPVAGSGNGNDTCPWESPGPGPSSIEKSPKKDNDFHSDNNINAGNSFGNIGTASTSRGKKFLNIL